MRQRIAIPIGSLGVAVAAICLSASTAHAGPPWRCYTCSITYDHPVQGPVTLHAGEFSTSPSDARSSLIDQLEFIFSQGWGAGLPTPEPSLEQWAYENMSCAFTPQYLPDVPWFFCAAEASPPDDQLEPQEPQEPPDAPYCEDERLVRACLSPALAEERQHSLDLCTTWIEPPHAGYFTHTVDGIAAYAESIHAPVRWDEMFCARYDAPFPR